MEPREDGEKTRVSQRSRSGKGHITELDSYTARVGKQPLQLLSGPCDEPAIASPPGALCLFSEKITAAWCTVTGRCTHTTALCPSGFKCVWKPGVAARAMPTFSTISAKVESPRIHRKLLFVWLQILPINYLTISRTLLAGGSL